MSGQALKPSELKFLDKIKNYRWKGSLCGGSFTKVLLENILNRKEVVGKIVSSPSDGELNLWPKLQHGNLNPLLEILSIQRDKVKILISPIVGKCIGSAIHDISFIEHPLCFDRKKYYAKDVLSALSYLHCNSMYLLNLSDQNVEIDAYKDKAVICDFSCIVVQKNITKASLSFASNCKPPEVESARDDETLSSLSIDMWYCGLLLLQVFTQHMLPSHGLVKDSLNYLDSEVLKKANIGSCLNEHVVWDLRKFLQSLLCEKPDLRKSASEVYKSSFLQCVHNKIDGKARYFWENGGNTIHWESPNYCQEVTKLESNEESSLCSEIDVTTVSEANMAANMCHNDASCPKSTPYLIRTISEPGRKIQWEARNSSLRVTASFPSFSNKTDFVDSEKSDSSEINNLMIESDVLCDYLLNEPQSEEDINATYSSIKRSPYDVFLTEWEADISTNLDESVCGVDMEKEVENDIFWNSFGKRLRKIPSRNISKNRILTQDCSPTIRYDSRSRQRQKMNVVVSNGESETDANSHEISSDSYDVNLHYARKGQKSYGNTESNYQTSDTSVGMSANSLLDSDVNHEGPFERSSPSRLKQNKSKVSRILFKALSDTEVFKKCRRKRNSFYDKRNSFYDRNQSNDDEFQTRNKCNKDKSFNVTSRKSTSPSKDDEESCSSDIEPNSSSVESETITYNKRQTVKSKKSSNRRKWYHLLCPWCKKRNK